MKWIKGMLFLFKQRRKAKKMETDLYKAEKHALLALAYWKDCLEESDLRFQVEGTSIYVRLGK